MDIVPGLYWRDTKRDRRARQAVLRHHFRKGDAAMLAAFDSTQQALRAEMLFEYAGIEIDIRPTPKEITAGCAISIEFPDEHLPEILEIIRQEHVEIRGIYIFSEQGYVPAFREQHAPARGTEE